MGVVFLTGFVPTAQAFNFNPFSYIADFLRNPCLEFSNNGIPIRPCSHRGIPECKDYEEGARWCEGENAYRQCGGGRWRTNVCDPGLVCFQVSGAQARCEEPSAVRELEANQQDTDGDGLNDLDEMQIYETDPSVADTDGDGLTDGDEVTIHETDPADSDSDGDGLADGYEISISLNPNLVDNPALQIALEMIMDTYDGDEDGIEDHLDNCPHASNPDQTDSDNNGIGDGCDPDPIVAWQQLNSRLRRFIEFFRSRRMRNFQDQFFVPENFERDEKPRR